LIKCTQLLLYQSIALAASSQEPHIESGQRWCYSS